jgi:two-component system sensor histidine kinase YesM
MNKTISNYGYFVTVTPEIADEEWFIKASNTAAYLWRTQTVKNSKGITSNELSLSYRIPVLKRGDFAIVVINISDNYLKSRINNNTLKTQIAVNDDPIFYGANRKLDKKIDLTIDHENKYFTYSGDCLYGNKEALVELSTFIPLQSYDRIYISTIDYAAINDTRRITLICTTILLFSIIVPLIVVIWYTSRFSSRLDTLRGEMHKVSGGDYNIIDIFKGNDELSEVFTDLKIMIASIKELDKQIYQDKISQQKLVNHQQKMEFDMLASQINPHFLYNTLETIRMKAFANHDREVANAVKQLGKYMRHNLESSGTTTTLKIELEYIEIYLSIQKLRFSDRVNYSITVDPSLDVGSYKILPLLIQPIVENAILHGLEEIEENGRIHINVRPENELLIISVTDNGIGMYSDKLTELLLKIHSQKKNIKTSIGLYNIHQRILLCYGKEYGLDITSKPGEGTTVSLILPLHHDWEEA